MVARSLQVVDFYPIWHFKPFRQWWQNYLQLTLWSNKKKLIIDKLGKVPCRNRHLLFLVLWFLGSIRILKCCFLSTVVSNFFHSALITWVVASKPAFLVDYSTEMLHYFWNLENHQENSGQQRHDLQQLI